jgi:hypothetical protein
MANEVVTRGIVARLLSRFGAQGDGTQSQAGGQRIGKYGESYVLSPGSPKSLLAEEGSYFTANNAQTGTLTAATDTAFSATNPFLVIQNSSAPGSGGPVITLDYALAVVTVQGGATSTSVQAAITKDIINRYTSGGVTLTPVKVNSAGPGSVALVYAGNIVAPAASASVINLMGLRWLKPAREVAGDHFLIQFGSMDGFIQISTATSTYTVNVAAPCVLNPGESALIDIWFPGLSTTGVTIAPEISWWEK